MSELKELILARQYPESLIDRAIERARKIPRKVALLKVRTKNKEKQPIFAVKYDPMPMLAKHYRSMISQDSHLKQCFPKPPLTAYKRQSNIRNFLIKSKIPPPPELYPRRNLRGTKRCSKSCSTCPYIKEGDEIKVTHQSSWKILKRVTCESYNIIYILDCEKCGKSILDPQPASSNIGLQSIRAIF